MIDFDPVASILALYGGRGATTYVGEPVTQLEHALQTADLAVRDGASNTLIVAALLHDIGHLLHDEIDHASDWDSMPATRSSARDGSYTHFGAVIAEPIHLHVAAKRYFVRRGSRVCGALVAGLPDEPRGAGRTDGPRRGRTIPSGCPMGGTPRD